MAENLANFQFRDWVFLGLAPGGRRNEWQELATGVVDEAWKRYLSMEDAPERDLEEELAFIRAFVRRIEHLGDDYRRMPDDADYASIAANALGMMRPHTTAGIVVEARQARMLDDMRGGPVTEHAIAASIAASSIEERGWGDKTLQEVAEDDPYSVELLLAYDVLLGRMDVEEAIAILANSEIAFRRADELREGRLRGGPLTPNR